MCRSGETIDARPFSIVEGRSLGKVEVGDGWGRGVLLSGVEGWRGQNHARAYRYYLVLLAAPSSHYNLDRTVDHNGEYSSHVTLPEAGPSLNIALGTY